MPHEDIETDRHRGNVAMWRWKPHAGKPESTEDFPIKLEEHHGTDSVPEPPRRNYPC